MIGHIHSLESFGTVDGPGTRFVVFFKGCPMRCAYCHNPDTWEMTGATDMEAKYILEQYHRNESFYQNGGGLTVTGGEPLVQIDFLLELFELCKKDGIHTCLDTSGIMFNPDNAELMKKYDRLCELTDLVMLDDFVGRQGLVSYYGTKMLNNRMYVSGKILNGDLARI